MNERPRVEKIRGRDPLRRVIGRLLYFPNQIDAFSKTTVQAKRETHHRRRFAVRGIMTNVT